MKFKFLSFLILIFALILISKLFLVQVVKSDMYLEIAERQYITPVEGLFERGTIFFQYKNNELFSAATQISGFKLTINPSLISKPEEVFEKLNKVISLNKEDFLNKANRKNRTYEEILNRLNTEEADGINKLKIKGVNIYRDKWRFYPAGDLAAHLIGFVGYQEHDLGGRYGLERYYNKTLARSIDNPYINFFAEVFSNINKSFFKNENKNGNIITTIEPNVSIFLDKIIDQVYQKYEADSVAGIIMSPQDGSIYAMSVKPDFNLNNFSKYENINLFSNPVVENIFEFGSVVKPLIIASALDAGVIKADTKYYDSGSIVVEKKEIFNFDKKGRGEVSMQDVLGQSLNTGMVFIYQKLGKEKMRDYLFSFKLKEKTNIDLPNETGGLLNNLKSPREIEYANTAFGQGIAMTPINITRALASLGNGGYLVTPHLIKYVKYEDGTKKEFKYPLIKTKISNETSTEISRMLVKVMDESLKGGKGKIENHSIAVKTGTAQVANLAEGGYYKDRYNHSFFGYFPAYEPEFIVFLYAINPKGSAYASVTWADPFLEIAKFLLNYYEIAPDR